MTRIAMTGLALGMLLLAGGCATGPTDARNDSFGTALSCTFSSACKDYNEGLEEDLGQSVAEGRDLEAQRQQLEGDVEASGRELDRVRGEIATLDGEIATLQDEAARLKALATGTTGNLDKAIARLDEIRAEIVGLNFRAEQNTADTKALEKELDQLQEERRQLESFLAGI